MTTGGLRGLVANPLTSRDPLVNFVSNLLLAVALTVVGLAMTYIIARYLSGRLRGALERSGFQVNVAILLARGLWGALWGLGLIVLLFEWGVQPTALTAVVGVIGLALGLSLQQVLQNLVAGVYLLAERPFNIGDQIVVLGPVGVNHEGRVEDIQMRTTHLRNLHNELILIPNSAIFTGVVTNRTAIGGYATHVNVTFPRQTDPDAVREQVLPLVKRLPSVLALPQPELVVNKVTSDDWTASLLFWSGHQEAASDAVWVIGATFPLASVEREHLDT